VTFDRPFHRSSVASIAYSVGYSITPSTGFHRPFHRWFSIPPHPYGRSTPRHGRGALRVANRQGREGGIDLVPRVSALTRGSIDQTTGTRSSLLAWSPKAAVAQAVAGANALSLRCAWPAPVPALTVISHANRTPAASPRVSHASHATPPTLEFTVLSVCPPDVVKSQGRFGKGFTRALLQDLKLSICREPARARVSVPNAQAAAQKRPAGGGGGENQRPRPMIHLLVLYRGSSEKTCCGSVTPKFWAARAENSGRS
jgi:hypothetical protein